MISPRTSDPIKNQSGFHGWCHVGVQRCRWEIMHSNLVPREDQRWQIPQVPDTVAGFGPNGYPRKLNTYLPWTPKPWKMKVSIPRNMGDITPKTEGCGFPCLYTEKKKLATSLRFTFSKAQHFLISIPWHRWLTLMQWHQVMPSWR